MPRRIPRSRNRPLLVQTNSTLVAFVEPTRFTRGSGARHEEQRREGKSPKQTHDRPCRYVWFVDISAFAVYTCVLSSVMDARSYSSRAKDAVTL